MKNKIPPPIITLLVGIVMWGIDLMYDLSFGSKDVRASIAFFFIAVALVFLSESFLSFLRNKTTVNPLSPEKASRLVVSGVYKLSRNPMYLGMLSLLVSWMSFLGNPMLVICLAAFILLLNKLQIEPEEAALTKLFGDEYSVYCTRVRRWI